ncbi:MAG: polymerase sigma-70 factor, subfamily [Thermoanaerobaculia bacterium]|jgi:RNA polymerase sigma-70 factor (ECF subfamily)|nr:polymerase sigma-70 factor, subfamily [Thermoanaerobaculia bacterium]
MASQDALYEEAAETFGAALERLAGSYEADGDKRRDLLQDIHLAIWRSFEGFAGNCSLRTWVYRVAHNVAASHVIRHRRAGNRPLISLDDVDDLPITSDSGDAFDRQQSLERLRGFIQQLNPLERQVILLYLEGTDAASIAEITGISAGNVATKIHRIKKILAGRFDRGDRHGK